jgi:hypothetical protein
VGIVSSNCSNVELITHCGAIVLNSMDPTSNFQIVNGKVGGPAHNEGLTISNL